MTRGFLQARAASADDLPSLLHLEVQAFGADAYNEEQLRALIQAASGAGASSTDVQVAVEDGAVIAFAVGQVLSPQAFCARYGIDTIKLAAYVGDVPRVGYVKSMAVEYRSRRGGVGRMLTLARDRFFLAESVAELLLWQMPRDSIEGFHIALGYRRLALTGNVRYADGGAATLWHRSLVR